jgi:hypothetical protein
MDDDKLPIKSRAYDKEVMPINKKRQRGKTYTDEFTYSDVIHDFKASDVLIDSAITEQRGKRLFYRYPGKPPVMLHEDTVKKHKNISVSDGEEQAYYLLSQLEDAGFVTGWRKK